MSTVVTERDPKLVYDAASALNELVDTTSGKYRLIPKRGGLINRKTQEVIQLSPDFAKTAKSALKDAQKLAKASGKRLPHALTLSEWVSLLSSPAVTVDEHEALGDKELNW